MSGSDAMMQAASGGTSAVPGRAAGRPADISTGGQAQGLGMPRERYARWCEQQGREPYPFGRPG